MDLQAASLLVSLAVGLVIPAAAWIFKVSVTSRLDALTAQVSELKDHLHRQDRATAGLVDGHIAERVGKLEERVARLEAAA